jgi:putative ABC transport system permease protein
MTTAARRAGAAWAMVTGTGAAASAALGLLVLACAVVAVAGPRQGLALRTRALHSSFATTSAYTRSIYGTVDYTTFDSQLNGRPVFAADLVNAQHQLAKGLAGFRVPLTGRGASWAGLATAFVPAPGAARSAYEGSTPPQLEVLYRTALGRHARLAGGRLPARVTKGPGGPVFQVAVSAATAARFGLRPGSRLSMGPVTLTVTGLITPIGPGSAYWTVDPNAAAPTLNQQSPRSPLYWIGAAFVAAPELAALQRWSDTPKVQLMWDFPLSLGWVTAGQAQALASRLTAATTQAGGVFAGGTGVPITIGLSTGVSALLGIFLQEEAAITSITGLLSVSLTVIGAVVILLAARLVAERRSGEFAVMRARGASRLQVAATAFRAGAVAAIPAAAAGAALGAGLTPGYSDPLAWWLAGLTVAVALAGPTLIAARSHAVSGAGRSRPDRPPSRRAAARRLVIEVTLAAAAVGGLVVLRRQGPSAGGSDLYPSAVPALIAVPAAIVVIRCYPLVIRLLLRVAGIRPGVTAFVGLARAARAPVSAVLPAFALVLALAVVAFGAMINAAVLRGQVAASWQRLGADAIIDASVSPQPLTPAVQRRIAAVPGVEHTAGVLVTAASTATGQVLGVAAVDPARYAALVAATPRPPFPAAALARRDRPAGGPVPALGSPAAVTLAGRERTTVDVGLTKLAIRIVGTTGSVPAMPAGAFVVLPDWGLGTARQPPTVLLVVGPHLDERALLASVHRTLLGATVSFRSRFLAGLTGAPLPHGASTAFRQGAAAAAGFSLLILLITLLLSARSREFTLARLRVMGLSQGQARWIVIVETLPQVAAAVIGGIGAAWALALLVGPTIGLAAFTGTGRSVPIRVEALPLAAAAVTLLVLALIALAGQIVIADQRGGARALRVAE